jgi:hypothetical protein
MLFYYLQILVFLQRHVHFLRVYHRISLRLFAVINISIISTARDQTRKSLSRLGGRCLDNWLLWKFVVNLNMMVLNHRNQNPVGLPQLSQFFDSFTVSVVEIVFLFEVSQKLDILGWQVLHLRAEGNDCLLHLVLFILPFGLVTQIAVPSDLVLAVYSYFLIFGLKNATWIWNLCWVEFLFIPHL